MPDNQRQKFEWLKTQIAEIKELEGLKLKEIAQRIGVEPSYLSRCANGHSPVSEKLIEKFKAKFSAAGPDEEKSFQERQSPYSVTLSRNVIKIMQRHNDDLKQNLDDLRSNIEDLRRENQQITEYLQTYKSNDNEQK